MGMHFQKEEVVPPARGQYNLRTALSLWLLLLFASSLDRLVEALEEPRAVSREEGTWSSRYCPQIAQLSQDFAAGQRLMDRILVELATAHVDYASILLQRAQGQRNIARNHDIVLGDMFRNPIIRCIETTRDDHQFKPLLGRSAHQRIRYELDVEPISLRHAIDLLLHGTSIGIDEDLRHARLLT